MSGRLAPWPVLALLVCAPLALTFASEWLAVDRCLDAGGSYDYILAACDPTQSHAFVPFWARHRAGMALTLTLAGICAFLAVRAHYRAKRLRSN